MSSAPGRGSEQLCAEWRQAGGEKDARLDWRVDCQGSCRRLEVSIHQGSGDLDLYGEADRLPRLRLEMLSA